MIAFDNDLPLLLPEFASYPARLDLLLDDVLADHPDIGVDAPTIALYCESRLSGIEPLWLEICLSEHDRTHLERSVKPRLLARL